MVTAGKLQQLSSHVGMKWVFIYSMTGYLLFMSIIRPSKGASKLSVMRNFESYVSVREPSLLRALNRGYTYFPFESG